MGSFSIQFEIANRNGHEFVPIEALVDTGASYTFISTPLLQELGVQPIEQRVFRLADDTEVSYDLGEALFRIEGREFTAPVIFGPLGVSPLLGVTALEVFGLGVDPVGERLIRVDGMLKRGDGLS